MVAYNFEARFAPKVESGEKRQTIRRQRKRPTRAGDPLELYESNGGYRRGRLLRRAVCTSVRLIEREGPGRWTFVDLTGARYPLSRLDIEDLARADGFEMGAQLEAFCADRDYKPGEPLEVVHW